MKRITQLKVVLPIGMVFIILSTTVLGSESSATQAVPATLIHTTATDFLAGQGDGNLRVTSTGDGAVQIVSRITGIRNWETLSQREFPTGLIGPAAVVAAGHLFVIGGMETFGSGGGGDQIYRAIIHTDGSLGPWTTLLNTPLPEPRGWHTVTAANGYLFVVGGEPTLFGEIQATVYSARVHSDGSLDPWQELDPLPEPRALHGAVAANGHLYVIGGDAGSGAGGDLPDTRATVLRAAVNPDGTLGPWEELPAETRLPVPLFNLSALAVRDFVYVIGGLDAQEQGSRAVFRSRLSPDGGLGQWEALPSSLPWVIVGQGATVAHDTLFVTNGTWALYRATVDADGNLSSWQLGPFLPAPSAWGAMVTAYGHLYQIGGWDGDSSRGLDDVFRASLQAEDIGQWEELGDALLLHSAFGHTSVAVDGYLFVIGGRDRADVLQAAIGADGRLGNWQTAPSLPEARDTAGAAASGRTIYVSGGFGPELALNGMEGRSPSARATTVYSATVQTDGTLTAWTELTATPLPKGLNLHASIALNGYLYVLGGGSDDGIESAVYRARIAPDGGLEPWQTDAPLPIPLHSMGVAVAGRYIFVVGGHPSGAIASSAVYRTEVGSGGEITAWVELTDTPLPRALGWLAVVNATGSLLTIGGWDGDSLARRTYRALINADGTLEPWSEGPRMLVGLQQHAAVATTTDVYVTGGFSGLDGGGLDRVYHSRLTDAVAGGSFYGQFDLGVDSVVNTVAWQAIGDSDASPVQLRYRTAASGDAFGPWSSWHTASPLRVNVHARYLEYEFLIDSASGAYAGVSEVRLTQGDNPVLVLNEDGVPVADADVHLYRGGSLLTQGQTDANGLISFTELQVGDTLVALALQRDQPSAKDHHDGWAYRVYTTSLDVQPDGSVTPYTVIQAGEQVLTVKKTNPLVLFNLLVSVEWNAYRFADQNPEIPFDTFLKQLTRALRSASDFLYDVTDGQFAFGRVTIYDAGRHWADADLQILASDQVRPSAIVGGISAASPYTYTSSAGRTSVYYPGFFRLGRAWNRFAGLVGDLDKPDAFRTLVHEFAHYALYLYDEYQYLTTQGEVKAAACTSPDIRTNLTDATNASVMDWHYNASELAMQGTAQWSAECEQTVQWQVHGESDWRTVVGVYADTQEPPRWIFKTPADLGGVPNPGPDFMPLDFPIVVVKPGTITEQDRVTLDVKGPGGILLPTQQVQVYLFRQDDGETGRIIDQGSSDSRGKIEVLGLTDGDVLKVMHWDGSLYTSQVFTSTAPLMLSAAGWNPAVESWPMADGTGLALTVSRVGDISGALWATLIEVGGAFSQTITLSPVAQDVYTGTFSFAEERPAKEGHLWLQATSSEGQPLETVTTYAIGGAPGSHMRSYPPIDPSSSDGNLRLHIPDGAVPDNTLVTVMPTRGAPAVPGNLTVVGTPYNIGASGGVTRTTRPAALTMFYSQEAVSGLDKGQLRIYCWDDGTGQWEDQGGVADGQGNFVSTAVDRFGVYAIMAEAASVVELYEGWNLFSYPVRESVPITQALASCAGTYRSVYTYEARDQADPWKKYVVGVPPYVNDLWELGPRRGYWIDVVQACLLAVGGRRLSTQTAATIIDQAQAVSEPPELPAGFYGTVKAQGDNVPEGISVAAWIEGIKRAEVPTLMYEGESVYTIDVPADDAATPEVERGGEGQSVAFSVGADQANQTGVWYAGLTAETNLTAAVPCPLFGDVNCDCSIDVRDIMRVTGQWGSRTGDSAYTPTYDLDLDGDIDIIDIMITAARWGQGCSSSGSNN